MVYEQKIIEFQGKMVFQRMIMSSDFTRLPKYFQEDEACFLFLTKGSFNFRTPTQHFSFDTGEGLLAKCGNYYLEKPKQDPTDQKQLSFIGAYFYPEIVREFFQTDLTIKDFNKTFDASKVNIEPILNAFLDSLHYLFDNLHIADDNLIQNKLKELLILLSKSEQAPSIHTFIASLFDPYQYKFEKIIQQNLYSNLSLKEFSHLCNCSLSTFKRKFFEVYKMSPAKYFLRKKLEKAASLLLTKTLTISDIAFRCAFNNVPSFNKSFKLYFHVTPTEYRLNHLEK